MILPLSGRVRVAGGVETIAGPPVSRGSRVAARDTKLEGGCTESPERRNKREGRSLDGSGQTDVRRTLLVTGREGQGGDAAAATVDQRGAARRVMRAGEVVLAIPGTCEACSAERQRAACGASSWTQADQQTQGPMPDARGWDRRPARRSTCSPGGPGSQISLSGRGPASGDFRI